MLARQVFHRQPSCQLHIPFVMVLFLCVLVFCLHKCPVSVRSSRTGMTVVRWHVECWELKLGPPEEQLVECSNALLKT